MFKYNTDAALPQGLISDGRHRFIIKKTIEKKSKHGDPLVSLVCKVLDGPEAGKEMWHQVAFVPGSEMAAGIAKHFLKCLQQPFEGEIDVEPRDWEGAEFEAKVSTEVYQEKPRNILVEIYATEEKEEMPF